MKLGLQFIHLLSNIFFFSLHVQFCQDWLIDWFIYSNHRSTHYISVWLWRLSEYQHFFTQWIKERAASVLYSRILRYKLEESWTERGKYPCERSLLYLLKQNKVHFIADVAKFTVFFSNALIMKPHLFHAVKCSEWVNLMKKCPSKVLNLKEKDILI